MTENTPKEFREDVKLLKKYFTPAVLRKELEEDIKEFKFSDSDYQYAKILTPEEVDNLTMKVYSEMPSEVKRLSRLHFFRQWTSIRASSRAILKDPALIKFIRELEIEYEGQPDYNHPYTPEQFDELFREEGGTIAEEERRKLMPEAYKMMDFIKTMEDSADRLENETKMQKEKVETAAKTTKNEKTHTEFNDTQLLNYFSYVNSHDPSAKSYTEKLQATTKAQEQVEVKKQKIREKLAKYGTKGIKKV
eukprot:TRINITY_DN2216_c0_g1_i1.p1 TRINITY_DN2216_c0_g1~~TRINITY_DN2216_c0_g1_i1.p1  ORF type:complete len:268 (-),score=56.73 TRINITY_DN2216_c0_g1_i1:71-817(-)